MKNSKLTLSLIFLLLPVSVPGWTTEAPVDVAAPPEDAERTPSGLATKVLQVGTGFEHPRGHDKVCVRITGWTADGKIIDRSDGRQACEPDSVYWWLDSVIAGWSEGLQLMVVGEKRRLWIPEKLAWSTGSRGCVVYDVELLEIIELYPYRDYLKSGRQHLKEGSLEAVASDLQALIRKGQSARADALRVDLIRSSLERVDSEVFCDSAGSGLPEKVDLDDMVARALDAHKLDDVLQFSGGVMSTCADTKAAQLVANYIEGRHRAEADAAELDRTYETRLQACERQALARAFEDLVGTTTWYFVGDEVRQRYRSGISSKDARDLFSLARCIESRELFEDHSRGVAIEVYSVIGSSSAPAETRLDQLKSEVAAEFVATAKKFILLRREFLVRQSAIEEDARRGNYNAAEIEKLQEFATVEVGPAGDAYSRALGDITKLLSFDELQALALRHGVQELL